MRLTYVSTTLVRLAALALGVILFFVAETPFQTVVIGALILLYLVIGWNTIAQGRAMLDFHKIRTRQLIRLARAVNGPLADEYETEFKNALDEESSVSPNLYIALVCDSVLGLWATLKIVQASL